MTSRERWAIAGICFLILFGGVADWYRKSRPLPEFELVPVREAAATQDSTSPSEPETPIVDLNRCGPEELIRLPGIGEKKADLILRKRGEEGPFKRVDDLLSVKGIGPKTLERLRPYLTVNHVTQVDSREE